MATERNVVDFKIHNLTEEQFQELKAQGKIDPNAVYCTPDESLKTNQITNCITEIPQDIKLELKDGALTLKAGSKVYVPNGAGVFDEYPIRDDVDVGVSGNNGSYLLFYRTDILAYANITVANCISGTTAPTTGTVMFYNTGSNLVRYVNNGSVSDVQWSLPLAKITVASGAVSIDQIFNGFGYIGSTIFALPGVEGLIPNGRNEDGTLKNIVAQNTSVRTLTRNSGATGTKTICLSSSGAPDLPGGMEYDEKENQNYNFGSLSRLGIFGSLDLDSNYKISNFNIKQAFHAVDYSDFENTVEEINSSISAVDSSAVHKTGNETIDGLKTFLRSIGRKISVDSTTAPSTYMEDVVVESQDTNNKLISSLRTGRGADGSVQSILYARKNNTDGTQVTANLKVVVNGDGNPYFQVSESPDASSNGRNIATTAWVRDLFEALYPVGSLYITSVNSTTCPLASIVKKSDGSNSTWALVSSGRALWTGTGSNGNTTIAAGLPNITGTAGVYWTEAEATGAFFVDTAHTTSEKNSPHGNNNLGFKASRSSSIYRDDVTTVQPPAYVVNVWRRTA